MKVAFSYLDRRISPVFDNSCRVLLVEEEKGRILSQERLALAAVTPMQRSIQLAELGIETLICGAISKPLQSTIKSYGIQVVSFVAGDLQEVVQAWQENRLETEEFRMPGCRCVGGAGRGRSLSRPQGLANRRGRGREFCR